MTLSHYRSIHLAERQDKFYFELQKVTVIQLKAHSTLKVEMKDIS